MKNLGLGFLVMIALFTSCENEFDVNADYKDIGVIYGVLDVDEPIQYVRINRAFLETSNNPQPADSLSLIEDSIYYANSITVQFNEYQFNKNSKGDIIRGERTKSWDMERVNAADEGLAPKEEGIFLNDPYYVYKTDMSLRGDRAYEVLVESASGTIIKGITDVVVGLDLFRPSDNVNTGLRINDNLLHRGNNSESAFLYDIYYDVTIEEIGVNSQEVNEVFNYSIPILTNAARDDLTSISDGEEWSHTEPNMNKLLNFIASKFESDDNVYREFSNFDIRVTAGNEELYKFIQVSTSSNTSIASSQSTNRYSNIENGEGMLISRESFTKEYSKLNSITINLIACQSEITKDLNFANSPESSAYPFCF